ncbi:cytochrome c oxidase subunit II [Sulfitobacter sabulilitoris]|uniref:Cytochrome c oxidase subunit 2 n=1 Tax=Sulfitobacter sabulilitoris TaxID=2562655 RepID=A0A5S3PLA8_9RHOB|nr:cytochrome c oxidase subunit II [Sulfitobacter sabulilitoris]TMM55218.1 cytochrome c oxidase subunit II [Sulfitobacter sabulilitoris]
MKTLFSLSGLGAMFAATSAFAQDNLEIIGRPTDGEMGFQTAVTELARDLQWLDDMMLVIMTLITLFVTGLILWVCYRYAAKRNPKAANFTHNTPVEIAWTVGPIVILVFIGAFSLPILFKQQEIPEADLTIKVTGYQWYWDYEYVDDGVEFSSYMIGAPATGGSNMKSPEVIAQLEAAGYSEDEFLLATDTYVVVPVDKTVVMQVTGGDVIHSWTIPAFGVKQDAVPGRLAELWFKAEREGIYFGQCSELCGLNHAYMPITVKVVSQEVYDAWIAAASEDGGFVELAAAMSN